MHAKAAASLRVSACRAFLRMRGLGLRLPPLSRTVEILRLLLLEALGLALVPWRATRPPENHPVSNSKSDGDQVHALRKLLGEIWGTLLCVLLNLGGSWGRPVH